MFQVLFRVCLFEDESYAAPSGFLFLFLTGLPGQGYSNNNPRNRNQIGLALDLQNTGRYILSAFTNIQETELLVLFGHG